MRSQKALGARLTKSLRNDVTKQQNWFISRRDYQHSHILNVHRWSDRPEANLFADQVLGATLGQIQQEPEQAAVMYSWCLR